jgi:hypothetical protein
MVAAAALMVLGATPGHAATGRPGAEDEFRIVTDVGWNRLQDVGWNRFDVSAHGVA